MSETRILLYDIETAPNLGYTWEKWQQNVIKFEVEWYILCFAWKWLGDKQTQACSLIDFPDRWNKDKSDDYEVVKVLHDLFDEADIVVAHNGNRFDQPKARARMLLHEMDPPSPFQMVDTIQVARSQFKFNSNSLDELCRQLGIGRKAKHSGFDTWLGCMNGDEAAWKRMIQYNKQDVALLEKLYLRLLPWMPRHPNVTQLSGQGECPRCGKGPLIVRGYVYSGVSRRVKLQCKACGGYCRDRYTEPTTNVAVL